VTEVRISMREAVDSFHDLEAHLRAVDGALASLEERDPDSGRLVEYRLFAGITLDRAARIMGLSPGVIRGRWKVASVLFLEAVNRNRGPG